MSDWSSDVCSSDLAGIIIMALANILNGHCSPPEVVLPITKMKIKAKTTDPDSQRTINFNGLSIFFIFNNLAIYDFIFIGRKFFLPIKRSETSRVGKECVST